jgi:hypothetical protein
MDNFVLSNSYLKFKKKAWLVSSNYLYRLLLPAIRGIIESGLKMQWKQIERFTGEIAWQNEPMLRKYANEQHPRTVGAIVFNLPPPADQAKKMSMEIMRIPLLVFGSCIIFCVSILVVEMGLGILARIAVLASVIRMDMGNN